MSPASIVFGRKAGLAFQIVDDVLDMTVDSAHLGKTAGKDLATEKATWPAVYGIEQSRRDAASLIDEAFAALEPYGEPRRRPQVRRPLPCRTKKLGAGSSRLRVHANLMAPPTVEHDLNFLLATS